MSSDLSLQPIESLLAERIGLDPESIGRDEVARAIRLRCERTGAASPGEYLDLLGRSNAEWEELVELVLVPESWFFREPDAFEHLDVLARRHAAAGTRRRFRALSVPCATGEEPYSMAIVLLEAGLDCARFRVDAVDISHRVIARARGGRFGMRSLRHVTPARLARHFEEDGGQRRIRDDVRAAVTFSTGNLVDPALLAGAMPYDVVFCRNVLIYFDAGARTRVLATLDRLLRPDGVLVTGHAESARVVAPAFVSAGVPRTFAYRKAAGASPHASSLPDTPAPAQVDRPLPASRAAAVIADVDGGPSHPVAPGGTPASLACGLPPHDAATALARARALADGGALDAARDHLTALIVRQPTLAEPYFLLGVVELGAGRVHDGEKALRRAVYLDPSHEEALTHLALAHERRGESAEAARFRRRALRARVRRGAARG